MSKKTSPVLIGGIIGFVALIGLCAIIPTDTTKQAEPTQENEQQSQTNEAEEEKKSDDKESKDTADKKSTKSDKKSTSQTDTKSPFKDNETDEDVAAIEYANQIMVELYPSKTTITKKLKKKGFSKEATEYALVDFIDQDFKNNALRHAREYTRNYTMSRRDLITILTEEEEFTMEEAIYAADRIGLKNY